MPPYSRRALRLRDESLALPDSLRERMRQRAIELGTERLARVLGVDARSVLAAIAGIPGPSTPRVLAALQARGLP